VELKKTFITSMVNTQ